MNRIKPLVGITALLFALILLTPSATFAQGLVPCEDGTACNACDLITLANSVITWLIGVLTVVFAVLVMVAGLKLVTSGGNPSAKTEAKGMMTNAFIGFVLVLAAWVIIDTLMRTLLPSGTVNGVLWYQSIDCSAWGQSDPTIEQYAIDVFEMDFGSADVNVTSPGVSGGTCAVQNSGNCAVSNLSCFGSMASQASQVCSIESGGNPRSISGTDLCQDGRSFSGGLFQINILANNRYFNNCSPDFFTKNGSGAQGTCLRQVTNSSGVSYCQIRDCRITNVAKYQACMNQTLNAASNIEIACDLFRASGNDFDPWITSARRCGVQ